jgi:two-component SAPR family response regulator
LIVEDEVLIGLLIEDILRELGCIVVGPAPNLSRAFKLLHRVEFDVAMLDINLGRGETVYPFADELARRGVPYCFLTAYHPADMHKRYDQVPVATKPVDPGRLKTTLLSLA